MPPDDFQATGRFESIDRHRKAVARSEASILGRSRGVRGFTESGGFHGDGAEFFEVELSPDLADELRARLPLLPALQKDPVPPYEPNRPAWWPDGVQGYRKDFTFFWLQKAGTRAWLLNIRT